MKPLLVTISLLIGALVATGAPRSPALLWYQSALNPPGSTDATSSSTTPAPAPTTSSATATPPAAQVPTVIPIAPGVAIGIGPGTPIGATVAPSGNPGTAVGQPVLSTPGAAVLPTVPARSGPQGQPSGTARGSVGPASSSTSTSAPPATNSSVDAKAPCKVDFRESTSAEVDAGAHVLELRPHAQPVGCAVPVTSADGWLTAVPVPSGFRLSVAANSGMDTRMGTVRIGGVMFTVRQAGSRRATLAVAPGRLTFAPGKTSKQLVRSFTVMGDAGGNAFAVTATAPWIHVQSRKARASKGKQYTVTLDKAALKRGRNEAYVRVTANATELLIPVLAELPVLR